jgi:hypothetical protein
VNQISFTTREGYDKYSWMEEANRHFRSAKMLRHIRRRRRAGFNRAPESRKLEYVLSMEAAVHSSTLLVAYAIELVLKSGLTRAYVGCSKELFAREVKSRFGHDLRRIAREIEYPLCASSNKQLSDLKKVILSEGRYPFFSDTSEQDIRKRNERARRFWDDGQFDGLLSLYQSLRKHVVSLDGDSNNPTSIYDVQIDSDGYFAFRCGGNLSPRIVVKYSSNQRKRRLNNKRALKRLITKPSANPLVRHFWDTAKYRCVKS